MLGIDTNVLVRVLVRDDEAQFEKARKLIQTEIATQHSGVNVGVIYCFLCLSRDTPSEQNFSGLSFSPHSYTGYMYFTIPLCFWTFQGDFIAYSHDMAFLTGLLSNNC